MQIVPIKDLKDTARISALCHETGEPVFVTKNGYQDLVIMSSEAYDELMEAYDHLLAARLRVGLREIENGEGRDAFEMIDDLRRRYGL